MREWLRAFNSYEFTRFENINNVLNALLALLTVLIVHDTAEGLVVRGAKSLSIDSVRALLLMRSHGSFSKMWGLLRGHPLWDGFYHPPNCDCDLGLRFETETCPLSRIRLQVPLRSIIITSVLRVTILLVELGAIFLAINKSTPYYLQDPIIALTPISNDFGEIKVKNKRKIGCFAMLGNPPGYEDSNNLNRKSQLVLCVRIHRPFEPATPGGGAYIRKPIDFTRFYFYIDLSGDKATLSAPDRDGDGAEIYSYLRTEDIQEAVVATVEEGRNYSTNRKVVLNKKQIEAWMRKLDAYLRNRFPISTYRTAYFSNSNWADIETLRNNSNSNSTGHPVPRMLMYFNLSDLAPEYQKNKEERVGILLQDIVGLQRKKGGLGIPHSTGTAILWDKKRIVEYYITEPILGSAPWCILLFVAWIARVICGRMFSNNFYELLAELVLWFHRESGMDPIVLSTLPPPFGEHEHLSYGNCPRHWRCTKPMK